MPLSGALSYRWASPLFGYWTEPGRRHVAAADWEQSLIGGCLAICGLAITVAVVPGQCVRWTGAGTIPASGFGYLQATIPLVIVELTGSSLTVRLRPAVLARLVGAVPLTAAAGDGLEVFPVRNRASYQGIEFRPVTGSSYCFFTRHRGAVLAGLANAGFPVSQDPGRERPVWY